jgi:hypothetical protein
MSTISSGTTLTTALVQTGDTTGDLVIKTNNGNTTAVTFNTAGAIGVGATPSYGSAGQFLQSAGNAATATWATIPATNPGGSNTQVQFNNAGAFGGSANLTFNGTTLVATDITDSSLTPGRVVFPTTGGNLTGSADLFWDSSNARLGIGTASPAYAVDVSASAASVYLSTTNGTVRAVYGTSNGASAGLLGTFTNHPQVFWTNNAERMRITSAGGVAFNGASNFGSSGQLLQSNGDAAPTWVTPTVNGTARAWVNFNGSGGSIRASFNVSSISVNGTGDYNVNFTSALADANYSKHCTPSGISGQNDLTAINTDRMNSTVTNPTASSFRVFTKVTGSFFNPDYVSAAVFR